MDKRGDYLFFLKKWDNFIWEIGQKILLNLNVTDSVHLLLSEFANNVGEMIRKGTVHVPRKLQSKVEKRHL